jgi:selT/selW/selH-like putative selenoprotein
MGRNFHNLREFLENRNSDLIGFIEGANYPPPTEKQVLAQLFSFAFLAGILLLIAGDTIFPMLKMEEPEIYKTMKTNKVSAFLMLFLMNNIGNSLLTTGAFEIYVDGELAFSKLESGHFPSGEELVEAMGRFGISL